VACLVDDEGFFFLKFCYKNPLFTTAKKKKTVFPSFVFQKKILIVQTRENSSPKFITRTCATHQILWPKVHFSPFKMQCHSQWEMAGLRGLLTQVKQPRIQGYDS
jgi:hypothetical protein